MRNKTILSAQQHLQHHQDSHNVEVPLDYECIDFFEALIPVAENFNLEQAITALSELLARYPSENSLRFSSTYYILKNTDIQVLAGELKNDQTLTSLDLTHNNIHDTPTVHKINQALRRNHLHALLGFLLLSVLSPPLPPGVLFQLFREEICPRVFPGGKPNYDKVKAQISRFRAGFFAEKPTRAVNTGKRKQVEILKDDTPHDKHPLTPLGGQNATVTKTESPAHARVSLLPAVESLPKDRREENNNNNEQEYTASGGLK